jgi:outer membrane lipoprotein-sorting protein
MNGRISRESRLDIRMRWRLVVLALLACGAAQRAFAFDAVELMDMMAKVERSSVAFEETKNVAALTTPLVRRGTLRYVRPDKMQMHVEEPYFERLSVTGEQLTIENRKGKRQLDLSTQPAVAAWIESLRATLSGDFRALNRHYRVRLSGERAGWQLELRPLERPLADVVQRVEISGAQAQVARIVIEESQGDRTVLVLSPLAEPK